MAQTDGVFLGWMTVAKKIRIECVTLERARGRFEKGLNVPQSQIKRNANGDYVHGAIPDMWRGYLQALRDYGVLGFWGVANGTASPEIISRKTLPDGATHIDEDGEAYRVEVDLISVWHKTEGVWRNLDMMESAEVFRLIELIEVASFLEWSEGL